MCMSYSDWLQAYSKRLSSRTPWWLPHHSFGPSVDSIIRDHGDMLYSRHAPSAITQAVLGLCAGSNWPSAISLPSIMFIETWHLHPRLWILQDLRIFFLTNPLQAFLQAVNSCQSRHIHGIDVVIVAARAYFSELL